jgi:hypothetical protein
MGKVSPVSKHVALYRNAAILSLSITLPCYVVAMVVSFSGYSGPPVLGHVLAIPGMVVFPGGLAMSCLSRLIPVNDLMAFFVLLPLCACTINALVALFIAWIIARLRDRRITQQDGAASGNQPIRLETNRTSPAAGSRR